MKTVHFITFSGLVLAAALLANHANAQTRPAGRQLSPEVTAAIFGDSRPRPQRIVPPNQRQTFPPASLPRANQPKKTPPARKQVRRIVGVTTLEQPTSSNIGTGQQATFQSFRLGGGDPAGKIGVSRFANAGMRPSEPGGLPVTPGVVPKFTQDQRAVLLELSVRERADRESHSYGANSYGGQQLGEGQSSGQPGGGEEQNSGEIATEQNPAPVRSIVSTALPAGFGANRNAQPSTGVGRSSASIGGPARVRRVSGIPRSPMILPAGQGRRSSRGGGGGCGGG